MPTHWSPPPSGSHPFELCSLQVLQNCDDLFDRDEFSAAPDIGWPDMFNSGVFVFRPSQETYHALLAHALSHGSYDGIPTRFSLTHPSSSCSIGGDQGLLNSFFSDWSRKDAQFRLPFIYNMTANVSYGYLAAYKQYLLSHLPRSNASLYGAGSPRT